MSLDDSILDVIGRTPMVRLNRIAEGVAATVLVKLEYLNPGGSVKDRAAAEMVRAAAESGELRPGGTVVESSSGNTGIGLAQAAAVGGYPLIVVVPDKTAVEKIDLLRAYGAEVIVTGSGLPRDHPEHPATLAASIADSTPNGWLANQYDNPANPRAHRLTTGPEIWSDTEGRLTHFVAGIGTGGTISGAGGYLKQVSGGAVQVVGVDPETSVFGGGDGSPFSVEASGHYRHPTATEDVLPESYDPSVVDRIIPVSDRDSILTARRLARTDGILLGGSAGLAIAGGLQLAHELGPEHTVVVLAPDSGRAYLSKYHSTRWLRVNGFLDDDRDGLVAGLPGLGSVTTVTTELSVSEALSVCERAGSARLPVVLAGRSGRFATAASEVVGVVSADLLASVDPTGPVGDIAGPVPFTIGTGETLAEAHERLLDSGRDTAIVVRDGRLHGVISVDELSARAAAGAILAIDRVRTPGQQVPTALLC